MSKPMAEEAKKIVAEWVDTLRDERGVNSEDFWELELLLTRHLETYTTNKIIDQLKQLSKQIDELDFKKIDRGNEAYNPAFQDYRMGFVTVKGFAEKMINNQIKALNHRKEE